MAGTTRKRLLKLMIEGAESAESAKDKLQFLSYAMLLYQPGSTKKKQKQEMTATMKSLLGLADSSKHGQD